MNEIITKFKSEILEYDRTYDIFCIVTSLTILLLTIYKFKQVDFCYLFLISATFSILWRTFKVIKKPQFAGQINYNPLFLCDFFTASFLLMCLIFKKGYNKLLLLIVISFLLLGWGIRFYHDSNKDNEYARLYSDMVHSVAHISAIIFFIVTFYILCLR